MSRDGILPPGVEHADIDRIMTPAWESETCGTYINCEIVPKDWLNMAGKEAQAAYCPVEHDWVCKDDPACER